MDFVLGLPETLKGALACLSLLIGSARCSILLPLLPASRRSKPPRSSWTWCTATTAFHPPSYRISTLASRLFSGKSVSSCWGRG
ncbi:hypothetical protein PR002_g11681 [Phytophthora rubi]|uniref:Uncharacterized protein n=1 Tax=Phytophthora rubi TaxID=129364 RepID=A0A6A3M5K8_9STRA|nr:hypothetical protein PR002_g11681 [Phytophthora rubi]